MRIEVDLRSFPACCADTAVKGLAQDASSPTRRSVSRAIFQPGTVIAEAAADLLAKLSVDLGYDLEAVE